MDLRIDFLCVFYFGDFKRMCLCVCHAFDSNDIFETFIGSTVEETQGYKKYECQMGFKGIQVLQA